MLSLHFAKLSSEPEILNFGKLLTFQNSREKALVDGLDGDQDRSSRRPSEWVPDVAFSRLGSTIMPDGSYQLKSFATDTEQPNAGPVPIVPSTFARGWAVSPQETPQEQIEAITIGAETDADLCRSDIIEAVNRVDSGEGVAILTDMFGGTRARGMASSST